MQAALTGQSCACLTPLLLSLCFCGPCQSQALVVWACLGCPGEMSAALSVARRGNPAYAACRDGGEQFPSQQGDNLPQTRHPAGWRDPPRALPCCAPSYPSPSPPPGTLCPAGSCDRMESHPSHAGGTHSPWARVRNKWKEVGPLSSGCCCQVIILHLPVSMATCWLSPVRGQRCVVLEGLPAGKISPRISILRKVEHLPHPVFETPSAAKV